MSASPVSDAHESAAYMSFLELPLDIFAGPWVNM